MKTARGFTIVELLIVVVVIAILAAITIVAYNGITNQANNAKRMNDLSGVAEALEMYYVDNGVYPASTYTDSGVCLSAGHWNCWYGSQDTNRVVPTKYYSSTIPQDPQFVDDSACGYPNIFRTRAYVYIVSADRKGFYVGAYLPGLSPSHPNYVAPASRGCASFINYMVKGGVGF